MRGAGKTFWWSALQQARCSDDWKVMYGLIRGLMQTAIDMRSYRRIRIKVFLRSDQNDETERVLRLRYATLRTNGGNRPGFPADGAGRKGVEERV